MERFFLVGLFCALLFLASGCQRAEQSSHPVELLSLTQPQIVIKPRWFKVADFKVENATDRNSEVHAGTVGLKGEDGATHCRLLQEKPDKADKWFPLALRFFTPTQPGKKFSKSFADTLSFSRADQTEKLFKFLVDFKKDTFQFVSVWKIVPYLAKIDGADYCAARAEICTDFEDEDQKLVCKGDWQWLKEIIAVPDAWAYLTGKGEKLTNLKAVFYAVKDGEVTVGEPVVLK